MKSECNNMHGEGIKKECIRYVHHFLYLVCIIIFS